ncbi:malto-oligosyltrehalose trehalohydrolase [Palleronia sp. LCG004]|uniref:malto-oligosyltrehalose trehalohydrolase n=1 Tax=Palleronia sp. LCG004 TaxID=3079304 RepID=UPI002941C839|nr:malto-oligosyltrehalose trehalohydrolase [Palleronia sp. LCG004]WOI56446.1 malto-oligosyltrehalose trehalohydrolase [Palleronia sp. LCG004]
MKEYAETPVWGARKQRDTDDWSFGLWAPDADEITLHLDGRQQVMAKSGGWHVATAAAEQGILYGFERDGQVFPDPASHWQDGGVHALSKLLDPATLSQPAGWRGRDWRSAVIMELHVGTFTRDGTLKAAARRMAEIAAMGFTGIELMPLGQFAGNRGWGYDVVLPYAVHPAYGTPHDLADFVRIAQTHGLMVIVDAVYNHFGPEGCVQKQLCPAFFDETRETPWGGAIDFDRPEVRQFFLDNATMWLRDYGVDGLRLDAVHQIGLPGDTAFLRTLADHVDKLDLGRPVHLVPEDERNLADYVIDAPNMRAQWNDDYHHAVHTLLTGESFSYYAPFAVDPFGDLVTAMRDGQVDQGQERPGQHEPRGEPSNHLPPECFVNSNQTHDQIGNRARGDRLISLTGPGQVRIVHALLALAPFIPMFFMGEEEGSRAPFQFFTDFDGDLARAVSEGRKSEFPDFANEDVPDPNEKSTFVNSRPYDALEDDAAEWRELTTHLLNLRHEHVVPLLISGWKSEQVERLSGRSMSARWIFEDGALEIIFTMEGPPGSLGRDTREIYYMTDDSGAGIRVGVSEG